MKNEKKGITLIALMITIIVLLILAGVTVATLTGDNGLLQKATNAKDEIQKATALEKIKAEVAGSYGIYGKIDLEKLNKNLKRIGGLKYKNNELIDINKIDELPAVVKLNDYMFEIKDDGEVSLDFEMILSSINLSLEPEEIETLTVTIAGEPEENITWTSDTPSVATVENNGKVTAVANGIAKITATYSGKSVVCNVTVATKLVNINNLVGKYVDINIGYVDQMNSMNYTAANIKKAWRVLSYDSNNGTVNLISTGHPLKFYHQVNPTSSKIEMDKISTQTITVNPSTTCGYRANGFSTNDVKSLFSNTAVFTGIQPARYSVEGVSVTYSIPDDLRKTGQNYWLSESHPIDNRCLWSVEYGGGIVGHGYDAFGVRPVVSLVPNITISGGSGTESSPYTLNGITYP